MSLPQNFRIKLITALSYIKKKVPYINDIIFAPIKHTDRGAFFAFLHAGTVICNYKEFEKLDDQTGGKLLQLLLMKMNFHIALNHVQRGLRKQPNVWQVACNLALYEWLNPFSDLNKELAILVGHIDPRDLGLPSNLSAEEYYNLLLEKLDSEFSINDASPDKDDEGVKNEKNQNTKKEGTNKKQNDKENKLNNSGKTNSDNSNDDESDNSDDSNKSNKQNNSNKSGNSSCSNCSSGLSDSNNFSQDHDASSNSTGGNLNKSNKLNKKDSTNNDNGSEDQNNSGGSLDDDSNTGDLETKVINVQAINKKFNKKVHKTFNPLEPKNQEACQMSDISKMKLLKVMKNLGIGNTSGEYAELIKSVGVKVKIPNLTTVTTSLKGSFMRRTFAKPRKREIQSGGIILAGRTYRGCKVGIIIDSSDSMSSEQLSWALGVVNNRLAKGEDVTLYIIDCDLKEKFVVRSFIQDLKVPGRGGTDIVPAYKKAIEDNNDYIIIISDALVPQWPEECGVLTVFCYTPSRDIGLAEIKQVFASVPDWMVKCVVSENDLIDYEVEELE